MKLPAVRLKRTRYRSETRRRSSELWRAKLRRSLTRIRSSLPRRSYSSEGGRASVFVKTSTGQVGEVRLAFSL